jgi:hypothetical protein
LKNTFFLATRQSSFQREGDLMEARMSLAKTLFFPTMPAFIR